MSGRCSTTLSSLKPVAPTLTHETTVTYGTTDSIEIVTAPYEFKILLKLSPELYRVSGYYQATDFLLDNLETSLSGVLLLAEYDGHYSRLFTWLWKYGLSAEVFNSIHLAGDWPAISRLGRGYVLSGCAREISVHEEVLEKKWSGRLLIQQYRKRFLLCGYLWQDIQTGTSSWVDGTTRSMRRLGAKVGFR